MGGKGMLHLDVLEEIKNAIREEIKAQKKYAHLAEDAIDPMLRDFFLQLKSEEENHQRLLAAKYDAILKMLSEE